jgi:hypothetical protein
MPSDARPRLPNLFIVGAPKCGTTAWVHYLRGHPAIFFAKPKEHCFFALDLPNFRLTRTAADYAKMFADSGDAEIIGEASAMYLFSQSAAKAIRRHDPKSKILIFLREQEEYLPSLHNQFLWEFAENIQDFETAWRLSGQRPPELIPTGCLEPRTLDYAAMGRFGEQIQRYLAAFPAEQLFVIVFRDWVADPRGTYLRILDFLGLPDDGRMEFPPINEGMTYRSRVLARLIVSPPDTIRRWARYVKAFTGPIGRLLERIAWKGVRLLSAPGYKSEITPELRDELRAYFAEDNGLLERLIRDTFGRGFNGPPPGHPAAAARVDSET